MKGWRLCINHVVLLLVVLPSIASAFDCRVFIFHPECRGTFGKRSFGSLHQNIHHQAVDDDRMIEFCSKYVFAPVCRGVTSKRANVAPLANYDKRFLNSILAQIMKQLPQVDETESQDTRIAPYRVASNEHEKQDLESEVEDSEAGTTGPIDPTRNYGHLKYRWKRDAIDDLGTFSSFYKRDPIDDLGAFSTFYKKNGRSKRDAVDDLGAFSTFYKKAHIKKRDAIDDLGSFATFYKRDPIDDLGGFTSFLNGGRKKRSAAPDAKNFNSDVLGTFSAFMDPYRYKRGLSDLDLLGSFSTIYNPSASRSKRSVAPGTIDDRLRREVFMPFSFLLKPQATRKSED